MEEQTPGARFFARRRRANAPVARQHFHKVKVTPEEEGQLLRLANEQNVTVPRLLVESTLAVEVGETATQRREAMANLFALYRLLGAISNNVNQMAKATNATGAVHVEMRATLAKVREVAEHIDAELDRLGESR